MKASSTASYSAVHQTARADEAGKRWSVLRSSSDVAPAQHPEVVQPLPPHPVHGRGQFVLRDVRRRAGRPAAYERILPRSRVAAGPYEEDHGGPYRLLGARLHAEPVPVDDGDGFVPAVEQVERVEVAVHPAGDRVAGVGRAAVGVPFQQGTALQQPVLGQFVEGLARCAGAHPPQQRGDQRIGHLGVRARVPARLGGGLHPGQGGVDEAEQRAQAAGVRGGEFAALAVPSLHPRVEREAAAAEHGDGAPVGVGHRWRDRQAHLVQPLGRPVLAGDDGGVGGGAVDVQLEEVAAAGGGQPEPPVQ